MGDLVRELDFLHLGFSIRGALAIFQVLFQPHITLHLKGSYFLPSKSHMLLQLALKLVMSCGLQVEASAWLFLMENLMLIIIIF